MDGANSYEDSLRRQKDKASTKVFATLSECDALLEDCEAYIAQAKSTLAVLPFAAINEWRSKRKDEHLLQLFDSLQPRVQTSEKALRCLVENSAEGKEALRKSAKDLQYQLASCIATNKEELSKSDPLVDNLRDVVDMVSSQSSSVKFMLQFNDEVTRQKISEVVFKERQAHAPWSIRLQSSLAVMSSIDTLDVTTDEDHVNLAAKLSKLRSMKEQATNALAVVLEEKESRTQSLSGCCCSKDAIDGILRREGRAASSSDSNSSDPCPSPDTRIDNISKVLAASEACVRKFEESQKISFESTKRLQKLVEIRERINEMDSSLGGE